MPADFAAIAREACKRAEEEACKPKPRRVWLRCVLDGGGTVQVPVAYDRASASEPQAW